MRRRPKLLRSAYHSWRNRTESRGGMSGHRELGIMVNDALEGSLGLLRVRTNPGSSREAQCIEGRVHTSLHHEEPEPVNHTTIHKKCTDMPADDLNERLDLAKRNFTVQAPGRK